MDDTTHYKKYIKYKKKYLKLRKMRGAAINYQQIGGTDKDILFFLDKFDVKIDLDENLVKKLLLTKEQIIPKINYVTVDNQLRNLGIVMNKYVSLINDKIRGYDKISNTSCMTARKNVTK